MKNRMRKKGIYVNKEVGKTEKIIYISIGVCIGILIAVKILQYNNIII